MTAKLPQHLQSIVENICQCGCQRVNEIIDTLDKKGELTEVEKLPEHERALILAELKHIMSVYDSK